MVPKIALWYSALFLLTFNMASLKCLSQETADEIPTPVILQQWDTGNIQGAALAPDGRSFITFGDGFVIHWDAATGERIRTFGEAGVTYTFGVFTPDGAWMAVAGDDHDVWLWSGVADFSLGKFTEQKDVINSLDFSDDGLRLASVSADHKVVIWNMENSLEEISFTGGVTPPSDVRFSHGRDKLLTGNGNSTFLWNATNGALLRGFAQTRSVEGLDFAPDDTHFAVINDFGEVFLHNISSPSPVYQIDSRLKGAWDLEWIPGTDWYATAGADRNVTIRTRENATDVRVAEGHQSPIISLDGSLDGSRLLSADTSGRVILWRIGEPAEATLPEPRLEVVGDDLLVQNLVAGTTLYVQQDNELTFADPAIKGPFTVQNSSFRLTNVLAGDRQAFPLQFYRALVSRQPIFELPDAHFIGRLRLDDGSLSNVNNSTWLVSGQTYQAQSSTVEVPNLFPGDHDVRVFHRPGNRWEVSELWAEITVLLNSGNNDWSVRRNQPYVLGYSLIDPADGLPAVELEQQDPFIVRSQVKNPSDQAREVRISYVYARNPLNGPEVPAFQAATATIPAGETLTLEWNQTFASVGAYSDAMMVETLLDDWYATGSTDWTENGLNIRTKTPGAFANVSPGNNNAFFTTDVPEQFEWTDSAPSTGYDVFLDKDNPDPTTLVASGVTKSQWNVNVQLSEGAWYWKIVAHNNDASREGAVWRFNVVKFTVDPNTDPEPVQPGNPIFLSDLSMTLLPIPEGTFVMGSPSIELDRSTNEAPLTTVTISDAFWLGQTEVTIDQFRQYLMAGGDKLGVNFSAADCPINNDAQFSLRGNALGSDGRQPMVRINWQAAVSYCEWLTAKAREQGLLLDGYECALPTEAQWEYACRALPSREPGTPFYYGEDLSYETLPNYAWYSLNSAGTTQRVAQKLPNAWGLHDMSGNVWEWCADWYADQYPGGNVTDPEGPVSGMERILRGGSYLFDARSSRSAIRFRQGPLDAGNDRGFRVAVRKLSN